MTLQDLQGENIKDKHAQIFGRKIDLLLVDETHFGARAEKYGAVLRASQGEKLSKEEISRSRSEDRSKSFTIILQTKDQEERSTLPNLEGLSIHFNIDFTAVWMMTGQTVWQS